MAETEIKALLFDLDDTLVWEVTSAHKARVETSAVATEKHGIDPEALSGFVVEEARKLWHGCAMHPYGKLIAVSCWEALWSPFGGDHPELIKLRAWAPGYRFESWRNGLSRLGVEDDELARQLGELFPEIRRKYHLLIKGALDCLAWAKENYRLALLSNGASDLQREKIAGAGIGHWFEYVQTSGDIEVRKPFPEYFDIALERLGLEKNEVVMIGNSLDSDVAGASAAGVPVIWFDHEGFSVDGYNPDAVMNRLMELPEILDSMS